MRKALQTTSDHQGVLMYQDSEFRWEALLVHQIRFQGEAVLRERECHNEPSKRILLMRVAARISVGLGSELVETCLSQTGSVEEPRKCVSQLLLCPRPTCNS